MRRWTARLAWLFASLAFAPLLAGCTGESLPVRGPSADAYFPMVRGTQWTYALSSDLGTLRIQVNATGERSLPGEDRKGFVMDERNLGPSFGFEEVAPAVYVVDDEYIARIEGIGYDGQGELRSLGQSAPTWILPIDPRPGQQWVQEHSLFATPDGGGALMAWSGEVVGAGTVSVPAGTFEDTLEVVITYRDGSSSDPGPTIIYRDTYARGIGLIRSLTEDPRSPGENGFEQVLLEVHFPDSP